MVNGWVTSCSINVKRSWVKSGAAVIDVGINFVNNEQGQRKIVGDVAFSEVRTCQQNLFVIFGLATIYLFNVIFFFN